MRPSRKVIAASVLSFGLLLVQSSAEGEQDITAAASRGRRFTRHHLRKKAHSREILNDKDVNLLLNDEDVAFWTRHLVGSIPIEPALPTYSPTSLGNVTSAGPSFSPPAIMTFVPTVGDAIGTSIPTAGAVLETTAPTTGAVIETVAPTTGAIIETIAPTTGTIIETIAPTTGAVIETIAPTVGAFETLAPTVGVVETNPPTNSCGLSPSERELQIKNNLSIISSPELFDQSTTPQAQALNWITTDDVSQLCPDDASLVQRYTLAVFYFATNGDNWNECSAPAEFDPAIIDLANILCNLTTTNSTELFPTDIRGTNAWLTPDSECLWGGVSCYSENTANAFKVNVIEMESNGLSGSLPEEIQQLTAIRFLSLERGKMSGTIPSSFGVLQSLLLIDFDFNDLTGTLPDSLWTLASLRQLDLNDNNLSGTLSEDIGLLTELRFIQVDNNDLTGTIPSSLGEISNINLIGLSGNAFEGAVPSEICALRPTPLLTLVVSCDTECAIPECCTSCVP